MTHLPLKFSFNPIWHLVGVTFDNEDENSSIQKQNSAKENASTKKPRITQEKSQRPQISGLTAKRNRNQQEMREKQLIAKTTCSIAEHTVGMGDKEPAGARDIRVSAVRKSLKIEPFKIPDNHLEVGRVWEE